jgi:phage FluMu protein Com
MIRCARCGSGFSSAHVVNEVSCPRCRSRDGVTASLVGTTVARPQPVLADSLTEMTRRVERGRARLRHDGVGTGT